MRKVLWAGGVLALALLGWALSRRSQQRAEAERLKLAAARIEAMLAGEEGAALAAFPFFEKVLRNEPGAGPAYYEGFFLAADGGGAWEPARKAFASMPGGPRWKPAAELFHSLEAGQRRKEAGRAFETGEGDRAVELYRLVLEESHKAGSRYASALSEARGEAEKSLAHPKAFSLYAQANGAWRQRVDAAGAQKLLREALAELPQFADARLLLSLVLLQEDRLDEAAAEAWTTVKTLSKEHHLLLPKETILGMAVVVRATAKYRRASRLVREADAAGKERAERLFLEARRELDQALDFDRKNPLADSLRLEMLKTRKRGR